jgi:hypothetical protein
MNKSAMLATASALGLLAPLPASAATVTLDWSVSGYGSGTITAGPATATHSGHTGYVATSVTGTWLGSSITLIPPPDFKNDNLVYNPVTASPSGVAFLDTEGVAFDFGPVDFGFVAAAVLYATSAGAYHAASVTGGPTCFFIGKNCNTKTAAATVTLASAAATPLPTSLPLFASGAAVVGLVARRRKKKSADIVSA